MELIFEGEIRCFVVRGGAKGEAFVRVVVRKKITCLERVSY